MRSSVLCEAAVLHPSTLREGDLCIVIRASQTRHCRCLLGASPCSCPVSLDILSPLFQKTAKTFGMSHHSAGCKDDAPSVMSRAALALEEHTVLVCIQDNRPGSPSTSWALMVEPQSVHIVPVVEEMSDSISFSCFMYGYLQIADYSFLPFFLYGAGSFSGIKAGFLSLEFFLLKPKFFTAKEMLGKSFLQLGCTYKMMAGYPPTASEITTKGSTVQIQQNSCVEMRTGRKLLLPALRKRRGE